MKRCAERKGNLFMQQRNRNSTLNNNSSITHCGIVARKG
jgi:hypothetical protein